MKTENMKRKPNSKYVIPVQSKYQNLEYPGLITKVICSMDVPKAEV